MRPIIGCGSFLSVFALALVPTVAHTQTSQQVVRDTLQKCQAGDAKACERFADGANFGISEDIGKFALPGAIEAMHPLCETHHDGGWTSYCHAEENIQAYLDAKANPAAARAAASQSKLMRCLDSSTTSRKVYTGQRTPTGPSYSTTYDTTLSNTCRFALIVTIEQGEFFRSPEDITLAAGETYNGSSVSVISVRRATR